MKEDLNQLIQIRQGREDDRAFIMATWLRGLYYGNPWFKEIEKDNFMKNYHQIITKVLTKPDISINIASLKDDEDVILGYSITEPKILHWIFVKETFRRIGIGKALIPQDTDVTTHLTIMGKKLKPMKMQFDPFSI